MAFCRLASDFIVRLYFVERPSEKSPLLNGADGAESFRRPSDA